MKAGTWIRGSLGRARVILVAVAVMGTLAAPAVAQSAPPVQAQRPFEVMTYNLYLGANLTPLFQAPDLPTLIQRAGEAYAHVRATDFNERAVAIARQIVETSPEVVGLQEASLWQRAPNGDLNALITDYDFLQILLDELARQGHAYRAVSVVDTFNAAVPISLDPFTLGVFTDRNAIIVRADGLAPEVISQDPMQGRYLARIPGRQIGSVTLPDITRGWASVDVKIRGRWFRLFDTHLEAFSTVIRHLQTQELMALATELAWTSPVVVVGDLNWFPPDVDYTRPEDTAAWQVITAAGFADAWAEAMGDDPGFTAGQTDDLNNAESLLDNRVDYVLHDSVGSLDAVVGSGDVVGDEQANRTDVHNLWPSDHAGVVVTLKFTKD